MDTPEKRRQLEVLAEELYELSKLSSRVRTQDRDDDGVESLTETENLAMDMLVKNRVMTVGEIQQAIGVRRAQMSRIVRALEDKGGTAFIECRINAEDRRRIDVRVTRAGEKAHETYRSARLRMSMQILSVLTPPERDEFMRLLRKIREHISGRIRRD